MSMATAQPKTLRSDTTRTAYTLVELLVVMAALTVLAAVTLPSLRSLLHDQKVTAASRMVLAHLQSAQGRAIASNSPVAVILERSGADTPEKIRTVSRLSIGQIFPPYEGDVAGATGLVADSNNDGYIDRLTIPVASASLLGINPPIFSEGDYVRLDDRRSTYVVTGDPIVNSGFATLQLQLPPAGQQGDWTYPQLSSRSLNLQSSFRIYRKPTKSFLQTLVLPRGTCVDLSVSGLGTIGREFGLPAAPAGTTMIVFSPQGRIAYWTDGVSGPQAATSLLHLLVGRTEQVSLADPPEVATENDTTTVNANVNDNANSWLTINPFTGAITSAGMQAGQEGSALAVRLPVSRAFATYGITRSEN
ncbi:MAG: prepilin-type N-terminal cleavage/methylation domain-containing protein [Pirellulaceae bacterium]|nr:prepilin-type N-terminal cleavage/methylation domain-containing protein [Pirellulaceae bacterium]